MASPAILTETELIQFNTVPVDVGVYETRRSQRMYDLNPDLSMKCYQYDECGKHAHTDACGRHGANPVLVGKARVVFCNQRFAYCCAAEMLKRRMKQSMAARTFIRMGKYQSFTTATLSIPVERTQAGLNILATVLDYALVRLSGLLIDEKESEGSTTVGLYTDAEAYIRRHIQGFRGSRIIVRVIFYGGSIAASHVIKKALEVLHPRAHVRVRTFGVQHIDAEMEKLLAVEIPTSDIEQAEMEVLFDGFRMIETVRRAKYIPKDEELFTGEGVDSVNNSPDATHKCPLCGLKPDLVSHLHPRHATQEEILRGGWIQRADSSPPLSPPA